MHSLLLAAASYYGRQGLNDADLLGQKTHACNAQTRSDDIDRALCTDLPTCLARAKVVIFVICFGTRISVGGDDSARILSQLTTVAIDIDLEKCLDRESDSSSHSPCTLIALEPRIVGRSIGAATLRCFVCSVNSNESVRFQRAPVIDASDISSRKVATMHRVLASAMTPSSLAVLGLPNCS